VLRFAIERLSSRVVWAASITGVVLTFAAGGCASIEASRHAPGTVKNGSFVPARPGAAQYGVDATQTCPSGGAMSYLVPDVEDAAKKSRTAPAKPDGRLCSAADTLLGWEDKEQPGETVLRFVASYFGLLTIPRVTITTLATEDPKNIAAPLLEPISSFATTAVQPRYGVASQRVHKDVTKVVLLLLDQTMDLDPVPRRLEANSQAPLNGRLVGTYVNPKIIISNPAGQLETPSVPPGQAFHAELRCADHPGRIQVQIEAEDKGSERAVANFGVACAMDQPTSVAIAAPAPGKPVDIASEEKKLFELVNGERTAAGLSPVAWDDSVARVARDIAETQRDRSQKGSTKEIDVVERLKQADVSSPLVLQNPARARSAEDAHARFAASSAHRANYMNPSITHAGIGIASTTDASGPSLIVTELFVREPPPVDPKAVRDQLRSAIARRRSDARASPLASDKALEDVAQRTATALAESSGNLPKAREDEIISPLRKSFRTVNVIGGAKNDPLDFAEEPGIVASAKLLGIGVAQGAHPQLGKNATYVVVLTGTKR
jgi:uncharacterized protein YkwD